MHPPVSSTPCESAPKGGAFSRFSAVRGNKLLFTLSVTASLFVCLNGRHSSPSVAQGTAPNPFIITVDGVPVSAAISEEIVGPESAVEYQDGDNGVVRTRPGNHKPGKIVVTKDWSNTSEWYTWRKSVLDGKVDRKSISVIFFNDAGKEEGRMNFFQCWPTKWTGPALNAKNSAHATEKLEIVFERMELK